MNIKIMLLYEQLVLGLTAFFVPRKQSHWGQVEWLFYCPCGLVHKIFTKKISNQLLTLLIISAIVQLEQKRGVQREQKEQKS